MTDQNQKPREWFAYFSDYRDLSKGYLSVEMAQAISGQVAEIKVVPKEELDRVSKERDELRESRDNWKRNADARWKGLVDYESHIEKLTARVQELESSLEHSAKVIANFQTERNSLKAELAEAKQELSRKDGIMARAAAAVGFGSQEGAQGAMLDYQVEQLYKQRDAARAEVERLTKVLMNDTLTFDAARELKSELATMKERAEKAIGHEDGEK